LRPSLVSVQARTGGFWPVIGMGIALEGGKLSAWTWLGHHGGPATPRRYSVTPVEAGLVALVLVLMMLNAIGAYGFLAKADIDWPAISCLRSCRRDQLLPRDGSDRQPFSVAPWRAMAGRP